MREHGCISSERTENSADEEWVNQNNDDDDDDDADVNDDNNDDDEDNDNDDDDDDNNDDDDDDGDLGARLRAIRSLAGCEDQF